MGAGAGRIPRRTVRARVLRGAKLHHGGAPPAHGTITRKKIGDDPTAAISGPEGVGHPALPSGGHT
jgi:hypothetical protein